jgi:hypothetical protein
MLAWQVVKYFEQLANRRRPVVGSLADNRASMPSQIKK